MLGMTTRRKPTSPAQFRKDFISRVKAARIMSDKSHQEVADALGVTKNTYNTWELRSLLPHQHIIPFCEFVGADPYFLLTGHPFQLGRAVTTLQRARN